MSKEKYNIEFNGDGHCGVEVYRPSGSHYVCDIVIESAIQKVHLYDLHFDVAETLRDQLNACLKDMLKDGEV